MNKLYQATAEPDLFIFVEAESRKQAKTMATAYFKELEPNVENVMVKFVTPEEVDEIYDAY